MKEIWKDIKDYEGIYQVSNFGRVKSFKHGKNKILKQGIMRTGRPYVNLFKDGKYKSCTIHRLVLIAFEGYSPDSKKWQVNHIDGDKLNSKLDNLEWETPRGNQRHRFDILKHKNPGRNPISIDQFDINGNFIQTFKSAKEAQLLLGFHNGGICNCLKGKSKTYKGYIWKYTIKKAPLI